MGVAASPFAVAVFDANDVYRLIGSPDDVLGDATEQQALDARPAVCADRDQVGVDSVGVRDDFGCRAPVLDDGLAFDTGGGALVPGLLLLGAGGAGFAGLRRMR